MEVQIIGTYLGLIILVWIIFRFGLKKRNPFRSIGYWTTSIISVFGLTVIFIYLVLRAIGGPPPKEGWNRSYFDNGNLSQEFFVKNGQLHGDHKTWYRNGQLKFLTRYQSGQEIDTSFCFYENGRVNFLSVYDGDREVYKADYYETGQLKSETYNPIKSNQDNYRIDYYSNGQKQFETRIANSTFEGIGYYYFENGDIKYQGMYKNGHKNGVWLKLDSLTGKVIDRDTFDFNKPSRFKDSWK